MSTLGKIFKKRKEIFEGVLNTINKNEFVETVAAYRLEICEGCEHYAGECSVPGTGPCCGACGCSISFKTRSMRTVCGMVELGKEPLWLPVLSEEQQEAFDNLEDDNE